MTEEPDMIARVQGMHNLYCIATNMPLSLTPASERWWYDLCKFDITPEDLLRVIKDRQRRIALKERNQACLLLRNICGSDEAICDVLNESSMLKAKERIPRVDKGKKFVLRATGRDEDFQQGNVRSVSDVIKAMRDAVEKGEG